MLRGYHESCCHVYTCRAPKRRLDLSGSGERGRWEAVSNPCSAERLRPSAWPPHHGPCRAERRRPWTRRPPSLLSSPPDRTASHRRQIRPMVPGYGAYPEIRPVIAGYRPLSRDIAHDPGIRRICADMARCPQIWAISGDMAHCPGIWAIVWRYGPLSADMVHICGYKPLSADTGEARAVPREPLLLSDNGV